MRADLTLPPLWSFLGQQPAHEQRCLVDGKTDISLPSSERTVIAVMGFGTEAGKGAQELENICKGFINVKDLLFQSLTVLLKLINVVKTLSKLNSPFRRNSAVYSGLNLRQRSFAVFVYKLCNVEMLARM